MKLCKLSSGAAEMVHVMFISYISLLNPGTLFFSAQQGRRGRVNPFLSSLRQTECASFLDSRALLPTITKPVITVCVRLCLIRLMSLCCNLSAVQLSSVRTVREATEEEISEGTSRWGWEGGLVWCLARDFQNVSEFPLLLRSHENWICAQEGVYQLPTYECVVVHFRL